MTSAVLLSVFVLVVFILGLAFGHSVRRGPQGFIGEAGRDGIPGPKGDKGEPGRAAYITDRQYKSIIKAIKKAEVLD